VGEVERGDMRWMVSEDGKGCDARVGQEVGGGGALGEMERG
jgi:hypothetical protein